MVKAAKVRMDLIIDISRRVTEDIRDLDQSTGHWGTEDYADALSSVGDLYTYASAQMLFNTYANDDDASVVDHMTMVLQQATDEAEEALNTLTDFGFSYTLTDLVSNPIDSI